MKVRVYNPTTNQVKYVQPSAVPHVKAIGFIPQEEPRIAEEIKLEKPNTKTKTNAANQ